MIKSAFYLLFQIHVPALLMFTCSKLLPLIMKQEDEAEGKADEENKKCSKEEGNS